MPWEKTLCKIDEVDEEDETEIDEVECDECETEWNDEDFNIKQKH